MPLLSLASGTSTTLDLWITAAPRVFQESKSFLRRGYSKKWD
jgi:hypothetical protein